MNDFIAELVPPPVTEHALRLDPDHVRGLRALTPEKARQVMGMTTSTHEVEIAETPTDGLVLSKIYAGKNTEALAKNERDILSSLPETSLVTFPSLYTQDIARDADGNPGLLINFESGYVPVSALQHMVQEGLRPDGNPALLRHMVEGIHEMHSLGIFHNDLHDNNIGILPPKGREANNRVMIIDFDLSQRDDYVTPEDMITDLRKISAYMLPSRSESEYEGASKRLLNIIGSVYNDEIAVNILESLLSVDD